METIKLLEDGRVFDKSEINFDDNNYTFTIKATGEDVTTQIPIAGKRLWDNFDGNVYSMKVYNQSHVKDNPANRGSESTIVNFADLIVTDPLGAPLDAANKLAKNTLWSVFRNPFAGMAGFIIVAVVVAVLFPEIFVIAYRFIKKKL